MKISDAQIDQLSALVDGESSDEERCSVLGEIIECPEIRGELRRLVDLRQVTGQWRNSRPKMSQSISASREASIAPTRAEKSNSQARGLSGAGYLTATLVGGLLVCVGLLMGKLGSQSQDAGPLNPPGDHVPQGNRQLMVIQPQEQRQAAEVFAFHESVAGPLSWFVSDEDEVRLGTPVVADVARQPVAVQLRIRAGSSNRLVGTFLVVCRDQTRTMVDLPVKDDEVGLVRLSLIVEDNEDGVVADYSLICEASTNGGSGARMTGRRLLGVEQKEIGQAYLNDQLLTIDAAAWGLVSQEPQL